MRATDSNLLLQWMEFLCQFTADLHAKMCHNFPSALGCLNYTMWNPQSWRECAILLEDCWLESEYAFRLIFPCGWSTVTMQWPSWGGQQILHTFILLFIKCLLLHNKHDIHSLGLVLVLLTVEGFHFSLSGHSFSAAAKKWGTNCRKLSIDSNTTTPPILANIAIKMPFNVLMNS